MNYLFLGFFTGLSLIFAIGAQNIFVIEQGLKKELIFLVCFICAISDVLLIFFGIFIFHYFQYFFTSLIEFFLNLLLLFFLIYFIWNKINIEINQLNLSIKKTQISPISIIFKTLGFTYLNPHVYSDTVFFLGNFSKNLIFNQKVFFGFGASISSIIFFFTIGYTSKYLSKYLETKKIWKVINLLIVIFMSFLSIYVLLNMFHFIDNNL